MSEVILKSIDSYRSEHGLPKIFEPTARPTPELGQDGYFAIIHSIVNKVCSGSDLIPEVVAMTLMQLLSATAGTELGSPYNTGLTTCKPWSLLVANTGSGKGNSTTTAIDIFRWAEKRAGIRTQLSIKDGVASGEAIISSLRDPSEELDKDGNLVDTGVADKRLLLIDDEFGSTLKLKARTGSILGETLMKFFDSKPVSNITKTNEIRSTNHHLVLNASITPAQLRGSLESLDMENGFLNRIPVYYCKRRRSIPFPEPITPDDLGAEITKLSKIIAYVSSANHQIQYESDAKATAEDIIRINQDRNQDHPLAPLLVRMPHYLIMLSNLFALIDAGMHGYNMPVVKPNHIISAMQWTDYWRDSIGFIWDTLQQEHQNDAIKQDADHIYQLLIEVGAKEKPISKTDLSNALNRNWRAKRIKNAIERLRDAVPSKVTVNEHRMNIEGTIRKTIMYSVIS